MTIKEFQERFARRNGVWLDTDHIRYLERKGVFVAPRNDNGYRDFSKDYYRIEKAIIRYNLGGWSEYIKRGK